MVGTIEVWHDVMLALGCLGAWAAWLMIGSAIHESGRRREAERAADEVEPEPEPEPEIESASTALVVRAWNPYAILAARWNGGA
jgi:hypothetical protein